MDTFVRRQYTARSCVGNVSSVGQSGVFPYKLSDVVPRNILKLVPGNITSDYIALSSGVSFTIPLPASYSSTDRVSCLIVVNNITKAVVIDPSALGTSTYLIKASSGATDGNHPGILSWQGRVTSIVITSPSALAATCLVQYFIYTIPDLTIAASWRHGLETLGVIP